MLGLYPRPYFELLFFWPNLYHVTRHISLSYSSKSLVKYSDIISGYCNILTAWENLAKFSKFKLFARPLLQCYTPLTHRKILGFLVFSRGIKWEHWPDRLTCYSPVLYFYTPWKRQKTFRFSDVFSGYRNTTPGCNGLILMISTKLFANCI